MWQAEVRVDLEAIRHNVRLLRAAAPDAELMAVVKADGYGHGMVPTARAALQAGAAALGVCTIDEAMTLRREGIEAPVLAWLLAPGMPFGDAIDAEVDLSVASIPLLREVVGAAKRVGKVCRLHLKLDTGLARGGATMADWPALVEEAAKAEADGAVELVSIWSHLINADARDETTDAQLAMFREGLEVAERLGVRPPYRHLANSGAILTRPDTHFNMVRAGIAIYGLSPIPGRNFGLRPAMTARARVTLTKRVPAGQGVSYGHTYRTSRESTLAVVPLGYGDGVPRAASNAGPVQLAGVRRTIAGRVCMDQFVLDCGDDPVSEGDVAILFGPPEAGGPSVDDWAEVVGTINYEIVTRFGGLRAPRVYDHE